MGASYSHRSSGLHPEVGARRCRCSCSTSTQLLSAGGLIKFACRPLVKTRSQRPWRRAWLQRLILSLPNFFHPPPALPRPPPGARGLRATALVIAGVRLHELVFFLARHVSRDPSLKAAYDRDRQGTVHLCLADGSRKGHSLLPRNSVMQMHVFESCPACNGARVLPRRYLWRKCDRRREKR